MHYCAVPGCNRPATRWGRLCSSHKTHLRRHGDTRQESVSKYHLKPYLVAVQARIDANPNSPLWGRIEDRWRALQDHAAGVVTAWRNGKPGSRHVRLACQEVVKIGQQVGAGEIVKTALAMYLMQDAAPRRFASDDGFLFQLVRRVRGLADMNFGSWYDPESGKTRRVYRDLPPKVTRVMGQLLAETFGVAGLLLARKDQEDRSARRKEAEGMARAVEELR